MRVALTARSASFACCPKFHSTQRHHLCIQSSHPRCVLSRAVPDSQGEESEALLEDLARYKAKQKAQPQGAPEAFQASGGKNTSVVSRTNTSTSSSPLPPRATQWDKAPGEEVERPATLRDNIDKFLMADFFFVLAILAWLVVGVAQSSFNEGNAPILDAWYPLWPLVFQPALGILMGGALVSGAAGWVNELLEEQKSKKRR